MVPFVWARGGIGHGGEVRRRVSYGRIGRVMGFVLVAACGSGDDGTDPLATLPQGSVSARIDGSSWSANSALTASYSGTFLAFSGVDASLTGIAIAIGPISAPGTFAIGPSQPTNAVLTMAGGLTWHARTTSGSGSVTVTSLTATGATGTFSFTAPSVGTTGATGTKVVTNGAFDVTF
jgi:hypothetical protein